MGVLGKTQHCERCRGVSLVAGEGDMEACAEQGSHCAGRGERGLMVVEIKDECMESCNLDGRSKSTFDISDRYANDSFS